MSEAPLSFHAAQIGRVLLVVFVVALVMILVWNPPEVDRQRFTTHIAIDSILFLCIIAALLREVALLGSGIAAHGLKGAMDEQTGISGFDPATGRRGAFEAELSSKLKSRISELETEKGYNRIRLVMCILFGLRAVQYLLLAAEALPALGVGSILLLFSVVSLVWHHLRRKEIAVLNSSVSSELLSELAQASKRNRRLGKGPVMVETTPDGNDSFY